MDLPLLKKMAICKREIHFNRWKRGLFEGKKIGRVKNLEKLQEEISAQDIIVEELKTVIQARHNEVIALMRTCGKMPSARLNRKYSNSPTQVFSLHNKLENFHMFSISMKTVSLN